MFGVVYVGLYGEGVCLLIDLWIDGFDGVFEG